MIDDIKENDETRTARNRVDASERYAVTSGFDAGSLNALTYAAQLQGFTDWADVERCARDHGHRVAIELLCRHRQRSAS